MTTTVTPSYSDYLDARFTLDHIGEHDYSELRLALQWVNEFETAVRDAVAARFADRVHADDGRIISPAWDDLEQWQQDALFDAAMVGARTAQGGAR
ncbi:hypothetical protein [Tsukamurella paurometabola]|uniref:Uncharacterized protein n=1 Tax=Tsukamurella paurometabola TaxID=2061 RepID=A0A3P8JVZ0_TSUPA|nr:hypothetical protein [Tsukamurella paurometabola]UEA84449.1 hypothetical protein LK411_06395 [Tsukamurella paurometabola]VDR37014.1 Uncharacterised protein [Tsukamurella paurometabola]